MADRDSRARGPRYPDTHPMGARIRDRREELDLTGVELAARVGISPSYLSLIENRGRTPAEDVARRLAEELGDDVDLYIAWSRSRNVDDLEAHLRRMDRYVSEYGDATSPAEERRPRGAPRDKPHAADELDDDREDEDVGDDDTFERTVPMRAPPPSLADDVRRIRDAPRTRPDARVAFPPGTGRLRRLLRGRSGAPGLSKGTKPPAEERKKLGPKMGSAPDAPARGAEPVVWVPLLHDGGDPDDPKAVAEILELDARLLPPQTLRPYAYRPDRRAARRVRGRIAPGDLVVLERDFATFDPKAIHAVRHRGRVVLTRAATKGSRLALLGPPGDPSGFELITFGRRGVALDEAIRDVVVGRVVATLHWW